MEIAPGDRTPALQWGRANRRLSMRNTLVIRIADDAAVVLGVDAQRMQDVVRSAIEGHRRVIGHTGPQRRKDAPESAVTIVDLPGLPRVCVKEFRWRGWGHALKGLFRDTQGVRTYRNSHDLKSAGIGVARSLALVREKRFGLAVTEWIVMEVVPSAMELDRYIVERTEASWCTEEKRRLVKGLARFVGEMHRKGIFHSDMKSCNILVSGPSELPTGCSVKRVPGEAAPDRMKSNLYFFLLDYDDVRLRKKISVRERVRNLSQIFLSIPRVIGATDRMRFLRQYARNAGIDDRERRESARQLLRSASGKKILYVGFDGDVEEEWR